MKYDKYELSRFSFYDTAAIQTHLEEMAAKGWMIRSLGLYFWHYQKTDPKSLHFAVVYLPKVSPYDPIPAPGQQLLEEYGGADGWKLEAQQDAMFIFSNDRPDPVPMETDPEVQTEGLIRLARKNLIPNQALWIVLSLFQLSTQLSDLSRRPAEYLTSPMSVWMIPLWITVLLSGIWDLIYSLVWLRRAGAAARLGQLPRVGGGRVYGFFNALRLGAAVAVLLMFAITGGKIAIGSVILALILAALLNCTRNGMKELGFRRGTNIALTGVLSVFLLVMALIFGILALGRTSDSGCETFTTSSGYTFSVYHDEMPLYVQELEDMPDVSWSTQAEESHSLLLSRTEYDQRPLSNDTSLPDLSYTVIRVKVPALYGPLKRAMIRSERDDVRRGVTVFANHYVAADAAPWGARDAYQLYWSDSLSDTYLLFYENTVVKITMPSSPTPEQMAVVGKKLGG